jgi:hypothetical protein
VVEYRPSGLGPSSFDFPVKGFAGNQSDNGVSVWGFLINQTQSRAELEADKVSATTNALAAKRRVGLAVFQAALNFPGALNVGLAEVMGTVIEQVFDGIHYWLL